MPSFSTIIPISFLVLYSAAAPVLSPRADLPDLGSITCEYVNMRLSDPQADLTSVASSLQLSADALSNLLEQCGGAGGTQSRIAQQDPNEANSEDTGTAAPPNDGSPQGFRSFAGTSPSSDSTTNTDNNPPASQAVTNDNTSNADPNAAQVNATTQPSGGDPPPAQDNNASNQSTPSNDTTSSSTLPADAQVNTAAQPAAAESSPAQDNNATNSQAAAAAPNADAQSSTPSTDSSTAAAPTNAAATSTANPDTTAASSNNGPAYNSFAAFGSTSPSSDTSDGAQKDTNPPPNSDASSGSSSGNTLALPSTPLDGMLSPVTSLFSPLNSIAGGERCESGPLLGAGACAGANVGPGS
ncbi:hypothetical protein C8Q75DRAFT_105381 [Abortiporus biennis]|nr:hypothetical protein C8Q75DRAFT_105381 [Abortiporus biennis]